MPHWSLILMQCVVFPQVPIFSPDQAGYINWKVSTLALCVLDTAAHTCSEIKHCCSFPIVMCVFFIFITTNYCYEQICVILNLENNNYILQYIDPRLNHLYVCLFLVCVCVASRLPCPHNTAALLASYAVQCKYSSQDTPTLNNDGKAIH